MKTIKLNDSHIDEIYDIECECFSSPWEKQVLLGTLKQQSYRFFGIEQDGRLLGYASVTVICGECYVNRIAVRKNCRRQGLANRLMSAVIDDCKTNGAVFISLEVRIGNTAAISLYKKHGFENVGRRRDFYREPTEDALIMTRYFM